MATLNTIFLPPPQNWSEFEDLCRDLWGRIWKDPNAQRYGRSGQGQEGVDVFGYPDGGQRVEGIQCKVKNASLGQYLSEQDVNEAVEKAQDFKPSLSRLTIATTSPRDAQLQKKVRALSDSRREQGKFPVTIAFWEEIHSWLTEHEDLLRKYYPYLLLAEQPASQAAASTNDLQDYLDRFREHVGRDLPPLIPTRLVSNEVSVQPLALKSDLDEHRVLHLYGPSGTGKSHLAKHLALGLSNGRCVAILIPGKYYTGDFTALLDRSVEHLTTVSAESLVAGIANAGFTPLLIFDGFNECPESLRADLTKDVKALQLRVAIQILITSRPESPCDSILPGRVYKLAFLDDDERDRLISCYGGPTGSIADILRTPLDVRIAAESAARIDASSPTQYDLFRAYAWGRLPIEPALGFEFLTRCASKMADVFTSALSEAEFNRLAQGVASRDAGRLLEAIRDSGLLAFSHGYCSFWHEKVQRFFQAEALLLQHPDISRLAERLRSPRNEDALEFVLGALRDAPSIQACFPAIPSKDLLLSMLHGELGPPAEAAVRAAIRQVLDKAHKEASSLTIVKGEEPSRLFGALSITSPVQWEEHEYRLISVLGRAFVEGFFCEEILELLEHSEKECLKRAGEVFPSRPWVYLFPNLYVGISSRSLPISRIIQTVPVEIRGSWSAAAKRALSPLLKDLERQSPGILYLLCAYAKDSFLYVPEQDPLIDLPELLRRLWVTGLYHLRLEAAELAQFTAHRIQEPLRSELEALLESFLGKDIILNSAVIEALAQYRDLGITSEESARSEIREVLEGPRDEVACKVAATLVSNQFEEIFGAHYYQVIEELQGKDKVDFYVMAALGMDDGYFPFNFILTRLIDLATPEARPVFEKWSSPPRPTGMISDDLAGVFLLAHIGLARTAESLPTFGFPLDPDEASWRIWGEILFWLHKPDASDAAVREACALCWRKLHGPLLLASVDPLFEMERYARIHGCQEIYRPVWRSFPQELKTLYEKALPKNSELTCLFGFPSHWATDRAIFMIEELGRFGDEGSVLILQQYVDSETLGRSAVKSIRRIRERSLPGTLS